MATTYRVLIGRNIVDKTRGAAYETAHPTWAEAKEFLGQQIVEEMADLTDDDEPGDPCGHCLDQAHAALTLLHGAPEGEPFEADIDGCDYLIVVPDKARA